MKAVRAVTIVTILLRRFCERIFSAMRISFSLCVSVILTRSALRRK